MFSASYDAKELLAPLRRLRDTDFSDGMAAAAEELVSAVNEEFETAGHGRWPGLAPSTLARRRGTTAQILVDTGRLAGSIRADSGPDFAEASTDVAYAVYHVSDAPRTKIPKRDFFDVPEAAFERAAQALLDAAFGA